MDNSLSEIKSVNGGAKEKCKGIVPLLVRQIIEAPEGNIELFGMVYSMACVVALVRKIETYSTNTIYTLEDHSGRIDAYCWLEKPYENKAPDVKLNHYVKVYGTTRTQAGQKTLSVFKLLPVLDPNEVCTHLLEVLNARYKAEYYKNKESPVEISLEFTASQLNGLDAKQQAVLLAIKSNVCDEGIGRKELKAKFSHISESELNNILDSMISAGHIYSSIDADHFIFNT